MSTPFETLGLRPWAAPDEIRAAYRVLVKQNHPDMVQDPVLKAEAQARMVQLNLAYEEALRLASPRPQSAVTQELDEEDAILLAEKMLSRGNPESALRQLLRSETKSAPWYAAQGRVLMAMEEFSSAHQSLREAIRLDPENREYRALALEASSAARRAATLSGRMRRLWKHVRSRNQGQ